MPTYIGSNLESNATNKIAVYTKDVYEIVDDEPKSLLDINADLTENIEKVNQLEETVNNLDLTNVSVSGSDGISVTSTASNDSLNVEYKISALLDPTSFLKLDSLKRITTDIDSDSFLSINNKELTTNIDSSSILTINDSKELSVVKTLYDYYTYEEYLNLLETIEDGTTKEIITTILTGDVNGDGIVDVMDVTYLINKVLGSTSSNNISFKISYTNKDNSFDTLVIDNQDSFESIYMKLFSTRADLEVLKIDNSAIIVDGQSLVYVTDAEQGDNIIPSDDNAEETINNIVGDINGDGTVDVADVIELIVLVLGNSTDELQKNVIYKITKNGSITTTQIAPKKGILYTGLCDKTARFFTSYDRNDTTYLTELSTINNVVTISNLRRVLEYYFPELSQTINIEATPTLFTMNLNSGDNSYATQTFTLNGTSTLQIKAEVVILSSDTNVLNAFVILSLLIGSTTTNVNDTSVDIPAGTYTNAELTIKFGPITIESATSYVAEIILTDLDGNRKYIPGSINVSV